MNVLECVANLTSENWGEIIIKKHKIYHVLNDNIFTTICALQNKNCMLSQITHLEVKTSMATFALRKTLGQ